MHATATAEALERARNAVHGARAVLPAHGQLAFTLLQMGRPAEAEAIAAEAAALELTDPDACDGLAYVSMLLGQHERANRLYHRTAALAPRDARFWYNLACSERSFGRLTEAATALERAIAIDATHYSSYLLRSELQVQVSSDNHVDELAALISRRPGDYRAQLFLGYALAKELDDLGRYEEAFQRFSAAAAVRRARLDYDVAVDERKLARIAAIYDRPLPGASHAAEAASAAATESSRFIFIVGLPRSGTTLVERILLGLPGVRSNGETDNFSQALLACSRGEGDVFARAAQADGAAVASAYATRALAALDRKRVIEKLPLNYLYLGAIRQALPEARLVLVTRSAMDSCFAMYRTLFASGYPFSYDLTELARYHAAYSRLMDHWRALLGDSLVEVVYEDLVRAPRLHGARLAAACGLAWDDAALDIQQARAVSLTASASQVRRPIYGSSSGRWRHYERQLAPLLAALGQKA
ncbi:MAG TPA: sulfotransferase [Steroidobacteraceae bacterium]|nr:sulfotransferase [Steroidobacteraceae bacterium]